MTPADYMNVSAKVFETMDRHERELERLEERQSHLLELACNYPVPEKLRPVVAGDLRRGRIVWDLPKEGETKEKPWWLNVSNVFDREKGTFMDGVFGDEHSIEGLMTEDKDG